MKKRLNFKASRLFMFLFLSYLVVFIIPMLMQSSSYFLVRDVLEEYVGNSNKAILEQLRMELDARIEEVSKLTQQIYLNKRIQKFMYSSSPIDTDDRIELIGILNDLSSYKNITPFIDDFMVYFSRSAVLINSSTYYKPEVFYHTLHPGAGMSYESWYKKMMLQYNNPGAFLPERNIFSNSAGAYTITYIQSSALVENGSPLMNTMVFIDENKIKNLFEKFKNLNKGAFYILDSSDRIIYSTSDTRKMDADLLKALSGTDRMSYQKVDDREVALFHMPSSIGGLSYAMVISKDLLLEKVNRIYYAIWLISLICLLLGMLCAFIAANRNYQPIKRIFSKMNPYLDIPLKKNINELQWVEEAVGIIIDKDRDLSGKLREQWPVLRTNFLAKLLKGNEDRPEASLRMFEIEFPHQRFAVLLICIEEYGQFKDAYSSQKGTMARFVIASRLEEAANGQHKGYAVELEHDTIALIVNLTDTLTEAEINANILQLADEIKRWMFHDYGVLITLCIGGIYAGLDGIRLSCEEAAKALDYRVIKGENTMIAYAEISNYTAYYYYPIKEESKLIYAVKSANRKEMDEILNAVFLHNFQKQDLSPELVKCLFFNIVSTAVKILNSVGCDYKKVLGEDFDPAAVLLKCRNSGEIKNEIKNVFHGLCGYFNMHKKSHNDILKEKVQGYIREHYAEEGMSQSVIAEQMCVSSSYLSFFFKEQFGENMVDYINKVRIHAAQELLQDNKLKVKEVAGRVGYASELSLIRVMKKYTGTTPGRYRTEKKNLPAD